MRLGIAEQAEMVQKPVKYVGKIYKMGEDKMVVSIPKKVWPRIEKLIDKDLLVTIEEIDTTT